MSQKGNTQFAMMFTATPADVAEGEKLLASHAAWMEKTHHLDGDLQLLNYNVAKSPEFSNPLDPSSAPTGNTIYTLYEVYKNPEGLGDHWKQAQESWTDFPAMLAWAAKTNVKVLHGAPIEHSLW